MKSETHHHQIILPPGWYRGRLQRGWWGWIWLEEQLCHLLKPSLLVCEVKWKFCKKKKVFRPQLLPPAWANQRRGRKQGWTLRCVCTEPICVWFSRKCKPQTTAWGGVQECIQTYIVFTFHIIFNRCISETLFLLEWVKLSLKTHCIKLFSFL